MGWIGMLVGSYLGGAVGKLPGALLGAFLGDRVERYIRRRHRIDDRLRGERKPAGDALQGVPLAKAYALIGARASDSADELKRKNRELAKRSHPDALRAQGLSEEQISQATERMSRINAAWATIREARGL